MTRRACDYTKSRTKTTTYSNSISQQRSNALSIANQIMKIICAGFPKTGTKSIAKALRHLGFTVFDWDEQLLDSPDFLDHWVDVFQNGDKPDVKQLYQNADAAVDMPGHFFFEEILEAFPDCKVILTERDEDSWLQSWVRQQQSNLAEGSLSAMFMGMLTQTGRKFRDVLFPYLTAAFGSCNPKSTYIFRKRYRIHNHRVKSIVPADKLLVYNVKQGWKPLCDFLKCEVPAVAFPHENIKAEITNSFPMTRLGRQLYSEVKKSVFTVISVLVLIVITAVAICFNQRH